MIRRRIHRWLPMALLLGASAGCGEVYLSYTSGDYCPTDPPPAIVVRFVSAIDLHPVAVVAAGTLFDGRYGEPMALESRRPPGTGRTFSLAGGFGRTGIYDVDVQSGSGERFRWQRVQVDGDVCGPFTVVLQAPVQQP
jgi:hypothetical protein